MTCVECGGRLALKSRTHKYGESGLPNVVLHGVEVRGCRECGEIEVAIPNIEGLHRCIAQALIARASLLTGAEVRFLRKFLGYSSGGFAELMGVKLETVSRWENERQALNPLADRALRLLVLHNEPVEQYDLDSLRAIAPRQARRRVAAFRHRGNQWSLASAA